MRRLDGAWAFECRPSERREDAGGQPRGTAAIDELKNRVQVGGLTLGELRSEGRAEAGVEQPASAPRDEHAVRRVRCGLVGSGSHAQLVTCTAHVLRAGGSADRGGGCRPRRSLARAGSCAGWLRVTVHPHSQRRTILATGPKKLGSVSAKRPRRDL